MTTYPVDDIIPELKTALQRSASAVLSAPPGAGKTTRVPLALMASLEQWAGRIIMLEPRRIAAVSAARWMARTLGEEAGQTVGYTIRFERRTSARTRIEVVTEGILTRRIQSDPALEGTALVIFDEFHERSIHADLALALCLDIRGALRPDLKILVMSATLNCGPIASLLGGAPVVESKGRTFPVTDHYMPDQRRDLPEKVAAATVRALKESPGDILVFLPGSREIRACGEALQPLLRNRPGITVHPLYGDLPFEDQERAILPSNDRRIILATNIAETSLTIEGVTVVIDSGLTRRLQYDPSRGMNSLITVAASRASADQRRGRAGRLGPGTCYRLYSAGDYQGMQPYSPPEIMVSDLASLALELIVWGARGPAALSWIDTPPPQAWESAMALLRDLGAVDAQGAATDAGKMMARLPLHPRLARLMVSAGRSGAQLLGADLAALLSERDIVRRELHTGLRPGADPDIGVRLGMLEAWRRDGAPPPGTDIWALRAVCRISAHLQTISGRGTKKERPHDADTTSRLLLRAFPDRIAQKREGGDGRFLLRTGRGVRLSRPGGLSVSPYIVALRLDAGTGPEGIIHVAAGVTEKMLRDVCKDRISLLRRVEWDRQSQRIVATQEERLDALTLGSRPFHPSDEEVLPLLYGAIRSEDARLTFSENVRQFQGRVSLMRRTFPDESWPDLSDSGLTATPEEWLAAQLSGLRTARQVADLDILPPLRELLSWEQKRLLDRRAPVSITVPSGRSVTLDYTAGEIPVLSVKLQEMFGLADTPVIAEGRTRVLIHLLSPAMRPVQITRDLSGFWNSGYQQVKKELRGRYPKHPWPDDPWNAVPTGRTKRRT